MAGKDGHPARNIGASEVHATSGQQHGRLGLITCLFRVIVSKNGNFFVFFFDGFRCRFGPVVRVNFVSRGNSLYRARRSGGPVVALFNRTDSTMKRIAMLHFRLNYQLVRLQTKHIDAIGLYPHALLQRKTNSPPPAIVVLPRRHTHVLILSLYLSPVEHTQSATNYSAVAPNQEIGSYVFPPKFVLAVASTAGTLWHVVHRINARPVPPQPFRASFTPAYTLTSCPLLPAARRVLARAPMAYNG